MSLTLNVMQMEEMKVKLGHSLMEQKETEERCEFQLSQMMATMEKYKQENGKIVQQKEKELELLRSKSDDFTALKEVYISYFLDSLFWLH